MICFNQLKKTDQSVSIRLICFNLFQSIFRKKEESTTQNIEAVWFWSNRGGYARGNHAHRRYQYGRCLWTSSDRGCVLVVFALVIVIIKELN